MILINLLPHREAAREARKKEFLTRLVMAIILGAVLVFAAGQVVETYISNQQERNNFMKAEVKKLDEQIKEIASLKQEIESLRARQTAVENLQADRNLPVYLFDELVRFTPEGVTLKSIKQEGLKVTVLGTALTQERVSEFLRNISTTTKWLELPALNEIKSAAGTRPSEKVFEFSMTFFLKRLSKDPALGTDRKKTNLPAPTLPAPNGVPAGAKPGGA